MQKTERVGAVALLFILVTIVAVALWDDGTGGEAVAASAHDEDATVQQQKAPRESQGPQQEAQRRQQRPQQQARSDRDRHDGVRVTRAADRGRSQNLLAGAGDVAPVRARGAQDPVLTEQPTALQERRPTADDVGLDPTLRANGWNNGRQPRGEEPVALGAEVSTPRQRQRDSRKRKTDPAPAGGAAGPVASGRSHVVHRGETLGEIAQRRLGRASRWPEIAVLNGLDGERIIEGQRLRLPGDAVAGSIAAPSVLPAARAASRPVRDTSGGRTYTIRKGDVLGLIAQRELGTAKRWKEILSLNPGLDEKKLVVGATLLLPTTGTPTGTLTGTLTMQRESLVAASSDPAFRVR